MSWKAGDSAVTHDVYLGTDIDAVTDANTVVTLGVYIGNQAIDANSYDLPGDFPMSTTYYWRIDEVNNDDANSPWKGNIWKFTVANYIIIDDFESYDPYFEIIWYTWENPGGTGSYIGLGTDPFQPVRMGNRSMEYAFDNTNDQYYGFYSETERNYASAQNWQDSGVKLLTLFFYGDPANDANSSEQMYVGLGDSDSDYLIDYDGDMNDIHIAEWQEWNIKLSDFNDVTLTDVRTIYIGFGDPDAIAPGGVGVVYMDDIRLYPPKCVPEFGPVYDLSGNCIVDMADVKIIGSEWLKSDFQLAVSAPPAAVGHWTLDDGLGTHVTDSSVNLLHGTAEGSYTWVTGHIGSGAIDFSGGRVIVPDAAVLRSMANVTATAWIYSEESQNFARILVKGPDNREAYELEARGENDVDFVVREDGNDASFVRHAATSDTLVLKEWIHLAGTYDGTDMKLYVNSQVEAIETVGSFVISQDTNDLAIGNRPDADNAFEGTIDDVRVYGVALTDAEVAYLASQGTGYIPLISPANISDDEPPGQKIVNFRDFAVLMNSWLVEILWPQ
jgi:hypothetical protein